MMICISRTNEIFKIVEFTYDKLFYDIRDTYYAHQVAEMVDLGRKLPINQTVDAWRSWKKTSEVEAAVAAGSVSRWC